MKKWYHLRGDNKGGDDQVIVIGLFHCARSAYYQKEVAGSGGTVIAPKTAKSVKAVPKPGGKMWQRKN